MDTLVELWEKPSADEIYMIVGWQQWADAGSISSGLPDYLVELTAAQKIGEIKPGNFYLFQIPGTHHFLRPEINLEEGYLKSLSHRKNELFYAEFGKKGLVIFLGAEPHLNEERYAAAFFDAVEALSVNRVVAVGGVYGSMPYDKDREISCAYSLKTMKEELGKYAVRFSNYEGGTTIGSFLLDEARRRTIEFIVFYGFVPAYDFSEISAVLQGMRIDNDYKAWYDLMRRFNHMFDLPIDLSELETHSEELLVSMEHKLRELEQKAPQLNVRDYLDQLAQNFTERPFMPLDDVWERELGDLLDDM